jgi:putative lipoprotein
MKVMAFTFRHLSLLLAAYMLVSIPFPGCSSNPGKTAIPIVQTTPGPTSMPTSSTMLSASVTGKVSYLEKIALPPNAVVSIKLFDLTPEDAPQTTIGEQQIITTGKQVPFTFTIGYDPITINPKMRYGVRAAITVDGQPIFTSVNRYLVITQGNPGPVEMVLSNVAGLAREYQELRTQKGHWNGGTFNPDLDSPGGRLRVIMGALGETLGQPPFQKNQIVALMGEPDSIVDKDGAEQLIYLWRNWHDYLYFVCSQGAVVSFSWWYAWE